MTTITTGIKTIMGVLGNTGLTSAQLLIDGLIAGFGEVNKTLVGSAATGVKESVTKALESLSTLGTTLATDLAQGLFDKLTSEKARLVALAQTIASAIAAAMASAASSIGVIVDGAEDAQAAADAALASAQALSDATTKAAKDKLAADKKAAEDKKIVPKTGSAPVYGGTYADMYKAGINPNIKIPSLSKVVGTTATVKVPTPILKPTASASAPRGNTTQPSSSGNTYSYGRSMAGAAPVAVTINTQRVTPTVTPKTISKAIVSQTSSRRG
jgi:hypothetical protein